MKWAPEQLSLACQSQPSWSRPAARALFTAPLSPPHKCSCQREHRPTKHKCFLQQSWTDPSSTRITRILLTNSRALHSKHYHSNMQATLTASRTCQSSPLASFITCSPITDSSAYRHTTPEKKKKSNLHGLESKLISRIKATVGSMWGEIKRAQPVPERWGASHGNSSASLEHHTESQGTQETSPLSSVT